MTDKNIKISGAGIMHTDSNKIFKTDKGKKQLASLKKIHESRKKKVKN